MKNPIFLEFPPNVITALTQLKIAIDQKDVAHRDNQSRIDLAYRMLQEGMNIVEASGYAGMRSAADALASATEQVEEEARNVVTKWQASARIQAPQ